MSSRPERFVAACVQMRSADDKQQNVDTAVAHVEAAAAAGAKLVVLPETFSWRGPASHDHDAAEPLDGPTLTRLAALARRLELTLVAGSILEQPASGNGGGSSPYNTSVVLGPDGARLATYRKIHLFDVSIPGKVEVRESARRGHGADVVTAAAPLTRLGMSVCYDLRFPELYRALARAGAEILCVPAAFTFPTGAAHWEVLLRARAIENQCWVLAANQHGPSGLGHADYGHSMIIDPWGTVVACASDGERVVTAEIDLGLLAKVRREMPCLDHARLV
jgi:predicted amidohydrolase